MPKWKWYISLLDWNGLFSWNEICYSCQGSGNVLINFSTITLHLFYHEKVTTTKIFFTKVMNWRLSSNWIRQVTQSVSYHFFVRSLTSKPFDGLSSNFQDIFLTVIRYVFSLNILGDANCCHFCILFNSDDHKQTFLLFDT